MSTQLRFPVHARLPTNPAPLADGVTHVVALSGGKDSTALALALREVYPDAAWTYIVTPTGNELPELVAHWSRLETLLGQPIIRIVGHHKDGAEATLTSLIDRQRMLPNSGARWCTRMLKIQPMRAWLRAHAPCVQYVGLRADEEGRGGLYGDDVTSRYPLREWGWGLHEVNAYNEARGVCIPARTDCAWCYDQRLGEWKRLLTEHPEVYAEGEAKEAETGHTFRSPTRDTWPASLSELREAFASGRKVRGEDAEGESACRVCRL